MQASIGPFVDPVCDQTDTLARAVLRAKETAKEAKVLHVDGAHIYHDRVNYLPRFVLDTATRALVLQDDDPECLRLSVLVFQHMFLDPQHGSLARLHAGMGPFGRAHLHILAYTEPSGLAWYFFIIIIIIIIIFKS